MEDLPGTVTKGGDSELDSKKQRASNLEWALMAVSITALILSAQEQRIWGALVPARTLILLVVMLGTMSAANFVRRGRTKLTYAFLVYSAVVVLVAIWRMVTLL